ncbi:uncharacterized protein EI97DRAFT_446082 [Westerdykella ornata]|uniref:Uncharacterized protein n=1 Tax=Westerdykella ornata TaxID=318751 RepID=A0A6A6J6Q9_WESOR|nr:uncharacterized protein EI97DRAFT_446082 [Westerdykella ornata]KAF2272092.1 hypothetical protein EI97DRAFT_446082 [Westerdykella ornata]
MPGDVQPSVRLFRYMEMPILVSFLVLQLSYGTYNTAELKITVQKQGEAGRLGASVPPRKRYTQMVLRLGHLLFSCRSFNISIAIARQGDLAHLAEETRQLGALAALLITVTVLG